jgi:hypothetical protein
MTSDHRTMDNPMGASGFLARNADGCGEEAGMDRVTRAGAA